MGTVYKNQINTIPLGINRDQNLRKKMSLSELLNPKNSKLSFIFKL